MLRKFLLAALFMVVVMPANADDCPDGYSIIDDSGLCKIECPDGYRVVNAGEKCAQIIGNTPYYAAKHTVMYGETSGDNVKKCPEPDPNANDVPSGSYVRMPSSLNHSSITLCGIDIKNIRYTTEDGDAPSDISHGVLRAPCYYTTGDDGHAIYDKRRRDPVTGESRRGCVGGTVVISCDAGYYAQCTYTGGGAYEMGCEPVGYNYYSPDGDLKRYPCPDGTMTCGYGDCADSIDDCVPYKTLHIGEDTILVMGTEKYMSPSLVVRVDNTNYYAQSTTENISSPHLRFMGDDGIKHTVINPLEQFKTVVRSFSGNYSQYCENGEQTYTHIIIP